jgi:putative serine protease PepD
MTSTLRLGTLRPVERSEPFGDDGADEEGDGESDALGIPIPPPERRAWRHPSELNAGAPELMPASAYRAVSGGRVPVALLAGAASALAIAVLLGTLLPLAGRHQAGGTTEETRPAAGLPTSTMRVVATLTVATTAPPTAPTGVVDLVAVTRTGERRAYATVVNGALVTTAGAVADASNVYVRSTSGERIDATVVEVSREGVAVLRTDSVVGAPAAIGAAADLDTGDTVAVMSDGTLDTGELESVGTTTRTATGDTVEFLMRADLDGTTMEGAPLLDAHGVVVGLCTHDVDGEVVGIPIELAAARTSGVSTGKPTGVTWLGLAARNGDSSTDDSGVLVTDVTAGGPAALGDLAVGDRIVAVNGRATATVTQLVLRLRAHRPHELVTFTVMRSGTELQRRIELGSDRDH